MKQKKDAWETLENGMKEHVAKQTAKRQEDMAALEQELRDGEEELRKIQIASHGPQSRGTHGDAMASPTAWGVSGSVIPIRPN